MPFVSFSQARLFPLWHLSVYRIYTFHFWSILFCFAFILRALNNVFVRSRIGHFAACVGPSAVPPNHLQWTRYVHKLPRESVLSALTRLLSASLFDQKQAEATPISATRIVPCWYTKICAGSGLVYQPRSLGTKTSFF